MLSQMHVCRYWPRWVLYVHVAKTTSRFSRTAHLAILHRHRPTTSASSHQHEITCTERSACRIIKLYHYARLQANVLRRARLREAISTCIIHTPGRCGTRCNLHRLLQRDTASTFGRREGRLQAAHYRRHAAATPSPTLHRQGLHQYGLHQHLRERTAAALSTRWTPSVI